MNLFRPPLRRLTILTLVAAAVIGTGAWFFGLDPWQSVLLGIAILAVGATWAAVQEGEPLVWPKPPIHRTPGARRDLETLSWSMKTRGGVHEKSLARVREAARHRLLFLYGLDLYDSSDREAIEQVLAPTVVRILLSPRSAHLDLPTFTRILSALEALGAPTERPS